MPIHHNDTASASIGTVFISVSAGHIFGGFTFRPKKKKLFFYRFLTRRRDTVPSAALRSVIRIIPKSGARSLGNDPEKWASIDPWNIQACHRSGNQRSAVRLGTTRYGTTRLRIAEWRRDSCDEYTEFLYVS